MALPSPRGRHQFSPYHYLGALYRCAIRDGVAGSPRAALCWAASPTVTHSPLGVSFTPVVQLLAVLISHKKHPKPYLLEASDQRSVPVTWMLILCRPEPFAIPAPHRLSLTCIIISSANIFTPRSPGWGLGAPTYSLCPGVPTGSSLPSHPVPSPAPSYGTCFIFPQLLFPLSVLHTPSSQPVS